MSLTPALLLLADSRLPAGGHAHSGGMEAATVAGLVGDEHSLGRVLDYAVIGSRLQQLYDWSAVELEHPDLGGLIRDGSPAYVWPVAERHLWDDPRMPLSAVALRMVTAARQPASRPASTVFSRRSRTS